jgi:hypothetical protein
MQPNSPLNADLAGRAAGTRKGAGGGHGFALFAHGDTIVPAAARPPEAMIRRSRASRLAPVGL